MVWKERKKKSLHSFSIRKHQTSVEIQPLNSGFMNTISGKEWKKKKINIYSFFVSFPSNFFFLLVAIYGFAKDVDSVFKGKWRFQIFILSICRTIFTKCIHEIDFSPDEKSLATTLLVNHGSGYQKKIKTTSTMIFQFFFFHFFHLKLESYVQFIHMTVANILLLRINS